MLAACNTQRTRQKALATTPFRRCASASVAGWFIAGQVLLSPTSAAATASKAFVLLHDQVVIGEIVNEGREERAKVWLRNGTAFIPVRAIAVALGAVATYDPNTRNIDVYRAGLTLSISAGRRSVEINGDRWPLASAPRLESGHMIVPVRILEHAGASVEWMPARHVVVVSHIVTQASPWDRTVDFLEHTTDVIGDQVKETVGRVWPTLSTGLAWLLIIAFGRWIFAFYGKHRIKVQPFAVKEDTGLREHSVSLVAGVFGVIVGQRATEPFQFVGGVKGPILVCSDDEGLASLGNALDGVDKEKILSNILVFITQPQFTICGTIYQSGNDCDIVVRADKYGKYFFAARKACAASAAIETIRELAFIVIRKVILEY